MQRCEVDGCEKEHLSRNLCKTHYMRFMKHGSTDLARINTHSYFKSKIDMDTDDCIIWEHGKTTQGYGVLSVNGIYQYAHRLALIHRVGNPTQGVNHALHSCHTPSCFNYKHLRWGTSKENAYDRKKDKTENRGARNGMVKLREQDIVSIREDSREKKVIAEEYSVSVSAIKAVKFRHTWKWVI